MFKKYGVTHPMQREGPWGYKQNNAGARFRRGKLERHGSLDVYYCEELKEADKLPAASVTGTYLC